MSTISEAADLAKAKRKQVKLTEQQRKSLIRLSANGAIAHYMPYMGRFNQNAYWYIWDGKCDSRATKQVEKLLAVGFLRSSKDSLGRPDTATITELGKQFLKAGGK